MAMTSTAAFVQNTRQNIGVDARYLRMLQDSHARAAVIGTS